MHVRRALVRLTALAVLQAVSVPVGGPGGNEPAALSETVQSPSPPPRAGPAEAVSASLQRRAPRVYGEQSALQFARSEVERLQSLPDYESCPWGGGCIYMTERSLADVSVSALLPGDVSGRSGILLTYGLVVGPFARAAFRLFRADD